MLQDQINDTEHEEQTEAWLEDLMLPLLKQTLHHLHLSPVFVTSPSLTHLHTPEISSLSMTMTISSSDQRKGSLL